MYFDKLLSIEETKTLLVEFLINIFVLNVVINRGQLADYYAVIDKL